MLKIIPSKFFGSIAIIATTIMLFLLYPYVFNKLLNIVSSDLITYFFFLCFFGLFWFFSPKKHKVPRTIIVCMIIQSLVWALYYIGFRDSSYITRIFFIILTYLICQVLVSYNSLDRYIRANNNILTLQAVLGAIAFVLIYINVLHPICYFSNVDTRVNACYILTCSNAVMGNFVRVGGYFDEPGALAFWCTYGLLFNKLFIKSKKIEILLLISLIFTFSAAFFIEAFIYLCLFYHKKLKSIIIAAVLVVLSFNIMMHYLGDNDNFLWLTTERFNTTTGLRNNRESMAEIAKAEFLKHPMFGVGAKAQERSEYMADNQYEILAKDGIVGYVVTYLPLIYLLFKCRRREIWYAVFILAVDFLQRPFHINMMHYLMLYVFATQTLIYYRNNQVESKLLKKTS